MRLWLRLTVAACLVALAGCARPPDPEWDVLHAQAQQQARDMVGKEYVLTAPVEICADQADVYERPNGGALVRRHCQPMVSGRFRVEEAVVLRDGRTLLRIAGPGIAGFMPYELYLPKPYKTVQEYFPTGR